MIVPSQRGYGGTDAPADAQTYSVKNLVADLTGLLDALGIEQGRLLRPRLGLDAGLVLGVFAPERPSASAASALPTSPGKSPKDMIETYDELRGPNHYMRTFQEPGVGEGILGDDVDHTFRSLMRGRGYTRAEFERRRKRSRKSRPASSSPIRSCSASRS